MKRTQFILLTAILGFSISATAQEADSSGRIATQRDNLTANLDKAGDTSVGLKWGNLTGVDFKHWFNQENALALGFSSDEGNTGVGMDYLWHFRNGIMAATGLKNTAALVPYIGAGLLGAFGDDSRFFDRGTENFGLALRAPLGLEYLPRQLSMGVFGEIAPSFAIAPTTVTFLTADVGARYYF